MADERDPPPNGLGLLCRAQVGGVSYCRMSLGRIGPYRLTDEIGRGGVGTVYRALDPAGRAVAIKRLHPSALGGSSVERMLREASLGLDHANVIHTLGSGVDSDGRPYLVMELLEGQSLRDAFTYGMTVAEVVDAVRQSALGLAAIHAQNVVHHDIKPENLFRCSDGVVKVLDLGLAALNDGGAKLTATGAVVGTPAYLAPEQVRGPRTVDARVDIWALGCVLYEGLTHVSPFRRKSALATLLAAALDPIVPIDPLVSRAPAALIAIVDRCLAKDPKNRFATATELVDALDHLAPTGTERAESAALPATLPAVELVVPASLEPTGDGQGPAPRVRISDAEQIAATVLSSPAEAPADLPPGTILDGAYRVEREIGRGAMGIVYLVEHLRLGRKFAAKVVATRHLENTERGSRLQNEARVASKLQHENIVDVTHLGQTASGALFIVMELLAGSDLRTLMQKQLEAGGARWLPDPLVRALVADVMSGLGAAHAAGIVHRDLKPDNIFVVDDGERPRAKIVDFGISRSSESEDLGLTRDGQIIGTPLYMAPEQARGAPSVDARADLYSLGVLCYELLTGTLPFHATSMYEMIVKHATEPPPPVRLLRADLPSAIEDVLQKSMAKLPADRYQDVASMREAWESAWRSATSETAAVARDAARAGIPSQTGQTAPTMANTWRSSPTRIVALAGLGLLVVAALSAWAFNAGRVEPAPQRISALRETAPVVDVPIRAPTPETALPNGAATPTQILQRLLVTDPPGATLSAGGRELGTTPCHVDVSATPLDVEVKLRGYRRELVSVGDETAETLHLVLRRAREAPPTLAPR